MSQSASSATSYRTSATQLPGYMPAYGVNPAQSVSGSSSYAAWEDRVFNYMVINLNSGNPAANGRPNNWDDSKYGSWTNFQAAAKSQGGLLQVQASDLRDFIRSGGMDSDAAYLNWGARPPASATEYIETPAQANARVYQENLDRNYALNVRQQDFAEAKWYVSMAAESAAQRNSSSGIRSSGGGGGGYSYGGGADSGMTAYQAASLDIERQRLAIQQAAQQVELEIARGRLSLDQAALAADQAYKQASLGLQRDQMAQQNSQFEASLALQREEMAANRADREEARKLQRAETIAKLSANPNDWVARDYFIHQQGAMPEGTVTDAFTGERGGQSTLQQVMESNAANNNLGLQQAIGGIVTPGLTGANATGQGSLSTPLATTVDTAGLQDLASSAAGEVTGLPVTPTPAARGTYGYTHEPAFIVGDATRGTTGHEELVVNPTNAPIAVLPNREIRGDYQRMSNGTWVRRS